MDSRKIMKFQLESKDVRVKEILKGDFLELELDGISDAYPNVNRSHFVLDGMYNAIPTIYNKPILGFFNPNMGEYGDFESHNDNGIHYDKEMETMYYDYNSSNSERVLGVIRESDKAEIVVGEDGLHWLRFTCCLWCAYSYKAVKSLLKSRGGKSSVSVEVEVLESFIDKDGIEHIQKFKLIGVTILGKKVRPGIEGANLSVRNFAADGENILETHKYLQFAYSALDEYNNSKNNNSELPDESQYSNKEFSSNQEIEQNQLKEGGNTIPMDEKKFEVSEEPVKEEEACGKSCEACGKKDTEACETCEMKCAAKDPVKEEEASGKSCEACGKKNTEACEKCELKCAAEDPAKEEEACNKCAEEPAKDEPAKEEEACNKCAAEGCGCEGNEDQEKEEESCIKCAEDPKEEEACNKCAAEPNKEEEGCVKCAEEVPAKTEEACNKCAEELAKEEEACNKCAEKCASDEQTKEEEACVKCERKCSAEQFVSKVDIDGQSFDINGLLEKYVELEKKFSELKESVHKEAVQKLISFGQNIVDCEVGVDSESKVSFAAQINAKCESDELASEEDVQSFARTLFALYFYDKKKNEESKNAKEFSAPIEVTHTEIKTVSGLNSLKDAIKNLDKKK